MSLHIFLGSGIYIVIALFLENVLLLFLGNVLLPFLQCFDGLFSGFFMGIPHRQINICLSQNEFQINYLALGYR